MRSLLLFLTLTSIPKATGQVKCECRAQDEDGHVYKVSTACFSLDSVCAGDAWLEEIRAACHSSVSKERKEQIVKVKKGRSFIHARCD